MLFNLQSQEGVSQDDKPPPIIVNIYNRIDHVVIGIISHYCPNKTAESIALYYDFCG